LFIVCDDDPLEIKISVEFVGECYRSETRRLLEVDFVDGTPSRVETLGGFSLIEANREAFGGR